MLPNNAKCAWCDAEFRLVPHQIARKKREGTPITCSRSCAQRLANHKRIETRQLEHIRIQDEVRLAIWKEGYDQCLVDYNLEVL